MTLLYFPGIQDFSTDDENQLLSKIGRQCAQAAAQCREQYGIKSHFVFSIWGKGPRQLPEIYQRICDRMAYYQFFQEELPCVSGFLPEDNVPVMKEQPFVELCNQAIETLFTGTCDQVEQLPMRILEGFTVEPFSLRRIEHYSWGLFTLLLQQLREKGILDLHLEPEVVFLGLSKSSEEYLQRLSHIFRMVRARAKTLSPRWQEELLPEVHRYIKTHFREPGLNAGTVAEHFQLNRSMLSNRFREKYGMPLAQFIKSERVHAMKDALASPNSGTVREILTACGFSAR